MTDTNYISKYISKKFDEMDELDDEEDIYEEPRVSKAIRANPSRVGVAFPDLTDTLRISIDSILSIDEAFDEIGDAVDQLDQLREELDEDSIKDNRINKTIMDIISRLDMSAGMLADVIDNLEDQEPGIEKRKEGRKPIKKKEIQSGMVERVADMDIV
jgi:hypothetical protein